MDRRAIGAMLTLIAVAAAVLWIPWATKDRVVLASTPVPPPIFSITPAPVKGGSLACMQQVTFDPHTQIAEIGLTTGGRPGPPLEITAEAPGYRARARIPAGYRNNPSIHFDLTPPGRSVLGQLCIRNAGRQTVSLDSTNEFRTPGRPALVIDGAEQTMDPKLIFYARGQRSYLERAGDILRHAAVFTPGFLPGAVLGLLALLALLGIPAAIVAALASAAREDQPADFDPPR
jgi:hypothetical protein